MRLEDLQNSPFFTKLLQQMILLVGLNFQEKAAALNGPSTISEDGENDYATRVAELFDNEEFFPSFNPQRHNYLHKKAGYVCKSPKGNLVYLIQPYDSTIYTDDPEDLPAQWGFYWSSNPEHAKEFVKSSTSPYYKGACCLFEGSVYRSMIDNNVYSPSEYSAGWENVNAAETSE